MKGASKPLAGVSRYAPPCEAPLWARSGHLQTLLGYLRKCPGEPLDGAARGTEAIEVDLPDGDRIVLVDADPLVGSSHAAGSTACPLDGTVVHLMHGLTGSTASNYMRLTAAALRRQGARVIGFNHRGQGPGAGLARGIYHSGSYPDLWAAVAAGRARYPDDLHIAVAFSLSANTALLGVTEASAGSNEAALPDAVLAVNPPVLLRDCAIRIETGMNRVYDQNFVRGMVETLEYRKERGWIPPSVSIPKGSSVRGADEAMTAPLAGYASADEYYAACSSGPRFATLRRPAIIVSAADDPFIAPGDIEGSAAGANDQLYVHMEPRGGHLGYLTKSRGPAKEFPGRWLAGAVPHYALELVRHLGR